MLLIAFLITQPQDSVAVERVRDRVVIHNPQIKLTIDERSGLYEIEWGDKASVRAVAGEVRLTDGRLRKTTDYATHQADWKRTRDAFGTGVQVTLHHRSPGEPELRHVFWLHADKPEAFVRLDAVSTETVASNYLAPIVAETPLAIPRRGKVQSLFVPYDNDKYFRFSSQGWSEGEGNGDGSYEVGAVYDADSRNGLVVGSVDHDLWKSAVQFKRGDLNEVRSLKAFAGVTSKYTHDTQPHGAVSGREVRSPRMVIGWYGDWRSGLERYGDLNALVRPPLAWSGPIPFGWNSWSGHKTKLNATHTSAATEFLAKDLPQLRSGGTAYVNMDSFWDNLSREERSEFVKKAHAAGLRAGIYWTPFVAWGRLTDRVNGPDDPLTYRDIALKDASGEPLPKHSGGYPLDPTHPGTLKRIDKWMADFVTSGYDYIKLDFTTHGALEGTHYDPKITTGTAAYALGMQRIVDAVSMRKIGRPFFISLSIAPMFPHGCGHARRISCDVFANIGASEYLLNSTTYGWWPEGRLYQFNDPDSTCVYQPLDEPVVTETEGRTRLNASVVSGGLIMLGDDMTKPEARARVEKLFGNREVLDLARQARSFRPLNGDSSTKAGAEFVRVVGNTAYVAVFNYDKSTRLKRSISFSRLGISSWSRATARDLWTSSEQPVRRYVDIDLAPMESVLLRLNKG